MVDNNTGNEPLDKQLRSTFTTERNAVEARRLSPTTHVGRRRSPLSWAPLALAAAALAIAGFFFFGNRTNDQAVELDVAAQGGGGQQQDYAPYNPKPTTDPTRVVAPARPPTPQPPVALPGGRPGAIPYINGEDYCFGEFDFEPTIAWGSGQPVLLGTVPMVGQEPPVSRTIASGTELTLVGGCTVGAVDGGPIEVWVEVENPGQEPDWIQSEFLISQAEFDQLQTRSFNSDARANECGRDLLALETWFVWDIGIDDPDGGLVAHTAPGVDEPVTRVLRLDEVVELTGGCQLTPNNSPWYELINPAGTPDWVSSRYLARPEPACLVGNQLGRRGAPDLGTDPLIHLVQPGDSLFQIAEKYNVSMASIFNANLGLDPSMLRVDEGLLIPDQFGEAVQLLGPVGGSMISRAGFIAFAPGGSSSYFWFDGSASISASGPCPSADTTTFPDSFADRPCAIDSSTPVKSAGLAGSAESQADHIHNLRVETNGTGCARVVVELGTGAYQDNDGPAEIVPIIDVTKARASTEIRFEACDAGNDCPQFLPGTSEPDRVDFVGGVAFVAVDTNFQPYVQILHTGGLSSVTLLDNPARLVVDISMTPAIGLAGPIAGNHAILAGPLVQNPQAPFLPADTPMRINGFAQPFEAAGRWHVFAADADGTLTDTPTSVASGFMSTSGWAGVWGSFSVEIPGLPPGDYIATFGEAPPIDEQTYWGSGQWFRVLEPGATPPPGIDYPNTIVRDLRVLGPILTRD